MVIRTNDSADGKLNEPRMIMNDTLKLMILKVCVIMITLTDVGSTTYTERDPWAC